MQLSLERLASGLSRLDTSRRALNPWFDDTTT